VEGSVASKLPESSSTSPVESTSALRENVRATLSPLSPSGSVRGSPRPSGEFSRSSFELGRRSGDLTRENLKLYSSNSDPQRRSTESRRHSRDSHQRVLSGDSLPTDLSFGESFDAVRLSDDDDSQSASSILRRSDVFRSPTMKKFRDKASSEQEKLHRRNTSPSATIRVQPPRRKHTHDNRRPMPAEESDSEHGGDSASKGTPKLQDIAGTSVYPLQRAAGWADWMKRRSKKMGTLLAAQPMGYLEKVSDMWTGGKRHYKEPMGMMPDEKVDGSEDEDEDTDALEHGERFRTRFALPETERLTAVYFGYLHRVLPLYGKIYLSNRNFCFRSMVPGTKTKMILPLKDIENVDKEKGFRFGYSGLVIVIRGHEEIFFEFGQADTRDDCCITLMHNIEDIRHLAESGFLTQEERQGAEAAKKEHQVLQDARKEDGAGHDLQLPTNCEESGISEAPPIVFDDPHGSILNFKPTEAMTITCLTIGSRGDVQPYIALCLGLMKDGHKTRIATHAEFKDWVESYGIEFAPVEGDPAELMQLCVEYGMFTVEFLKVTTSKVSSAPINRNCRHTDYCRCAVG
jgi:sterol 3beta-glucosyltransferase